MRAAEYYQRPPWELLELPAAYITMALMMMSAEEHAKKMQQQRSKNPWL